MTKFALWSVAGFFVIFLILLLSSVWAPAWVATPSVVDLSWGHLMFLALHVLAVIAAWIYIRRNDLE